MPRLLKLCGEWDIKLTSKRKSLRGEFLIAVVVSLILAVITEGVIICAVWVIFKLTGLEIRPSAHMNMTGSIFTLPGFYDSFQYDCQGRSEIEPAYSSYVVPNSIIAFALLFLIVGIILFLVYFMALTKKFSRYLQEIIGGIQEISIGNFENEIPVEHNTELSLVAEKLNEMSESIYLLLCDERQNEDVKNELITSVAHDIRTPLTSIIGYLHLAVDKKDLDEETRGRYLQIAYDKSQRLERLTEDLFSYTKYNIDEVKIQYEKIDLVKFMEQMIEEFYPSFQAARLKYDFRCEMKEAIILADGNTLARAFGNLLSNAIKYGKDGKLIQMELKRDYQYVIVSVINYGSIIPPENLNHIFERFYRVENSRSVQTGGTGLGLPIAKRIIELHNGSIEVRSDFEGTVFEVRLHLYHEGEDQLHEFEKNG